ncbi:hypothetical protein ACOMICROBIO_GDFFDHBD_01174 [Vibrio sp. B1REV9]|uniref:DUF2877 domain-containing protein n=1 Tax=Vibrio sp. B1REV9 TaxID=2751179 RepID=UPI001AFAAD51|nr:DUF2877 domain-containing protein [Vibrio sp. B1REV9]CAE6895239.1 hypothetical protein ACOMICROBIO_GDFFDHBD_01174 [Vibrio sp. B1REV9]
MGGEALAFSYSAPYSRGVLQFIGSGRDVLNFLTQDREVLSLHRQGSNMSPSGWSLSSYCFEQFKATLVGQEPIELDEQGLRSGSCLIKRGKNGTWLSVNGRKPVPYKALFQNICIVEQETGLYGPLGTIVSRQDLTPFSAFIEQLDLWSAGNVPCWSSLIGKGPGLTPSHDDMLIGMLFGAYLYNSAAARKLLPSTLDIHQLTTSVSHGYLSQASKGYFAQPLLNISLENIDKLHNSISDLLDCGHHSGADSLLGLWIFLHYIKESKL